MIEAAMLAHVDGQPCSGQERGRLSILQKKRSCRFIDRWWKGEHILRLDRVSIGKKPRLGAQSFKQASIGRRLQPGERSQYLTTKAVWIVATQRNLKLAFR